MSEKINDGGAAFPHKPEIRQSAGLDLVVVTPGDHPGMNLRDYFAAKAIQGMLTTAGAPCLNGLDGYEDVSAIAAYKLADAMIKARQS